MTRAEHSSELVWKNPATGKDETHVAGEPVGFIIEFENRGEGPLPRLAPLVNELRPGQEPPSNGGSSTTASSSTSGRSPPPARSKSRSPMTT